VLQDSYSIPHGTLPRQPVSVGFVHRTDLRLQSVGGVVYGKKCMGPAGCRRPVAPPGGLTSGFCTASSSSGTSNGLDALTSAEQD